MTIVMARLLVLLALAVTARSAASATGVELSDDILYSRLTNGFHSIQFRLDALYRAASDCLTPPPSQCAYRLGMAPGRHLDTLVSMKLHSYGLTVARGWWDTTRWGHLANGSAPDGTLMFAEFRSGNDASSRVETWLELREELTGRYGIAALRGNPLYRPFVVPRCSAGRDPTADCQRWMQHTPGEETGGSGGGGVCTDTVQPADWVDGVWTTQNGSVPSAVRGAPLQWVLSHAPYLSTSSTVSMRNMTCIGSRYDDDRAQRRLCTYEVASSYELHVVLSDAALRGSGKGSKWARALVEQQSSRESRRDGGVGAVGAPNRGDFGSSTSAQATVIVDRSVTDSKGVDIYFQTTINNTGSMYGANVIVTDVLPIHVDVSLRRYRYQYDCGVMAAPELEKRKLHNVKCVESVGNSLEGANGMASCVLDRWMRPSEMSTTNALLATSLSSQHWIPPHCALILKATGKKRFLNRETMPGDASRGVEVPPVVVQVKSSMSPIKPGSADSGWGYATTTPALLISLPIPDASMPFNVLTLVSTVAAFLFGSVLSAIVRKSGRINGAPKGFLLRENFVSESDESELVGWLKDDSSLSWERAVEGRRVLQFGPARYDYDQQRVVLSPEAPEIPEVLRKMLARLPDKLSERLVQCIVNEYSPDDAIPFHIDDDAFGENIVVFCFGESRPLRMRRCCDPAVDELQPSDQKRCYEKWEYQIRSRGCYQLSGDGRYAWEHSVPPGKGRRISVTFREWPETVK